MKLKAFLCVGALALASWTNAASAATILVAQCVAPSACSTSQTPTPWSDDLTGAQLASLGLGTNQNLTATQTQEGVIRLGVTTATFDTSGAPVVETLPEFSGTGGPNVLGSFLIPTDATSAVISGAFGNSVVPNSSGVDVYFGNSAPAPTPGEGMLGLAAVSALMWFAARPRSMIV